MQFRDLKAQYSALKPGIDEAIHEVLDTGNYILGNQVAELEEELAKYVGVKHCVTCANGTDALTLVLMAWGIGEGDAVFIPDFTFFATGEVVSFEGATPVFVDVDETTFNIDTEKLEIAIKKVLTDGKLTPKAIIAVDLFGLPSNYDEIEKVAKKYSLLVLEDSAQGFGGEFNGRRAGSFGDAATTSFFPAKPLGCYGDGGAIFTNDDELAELVKSYRFHGKGDYKYNNVRIGMNSRLDTIQAAVLKVKLKAFEKYELADVNRVADRYTELLKGVVKTPVVPNGYYSSWAQYTLVLESEEQRQRIQAELAEARIPTMIYYPKPMSEQEAFSNIVRFENDLTVTKKLCERVLALPMHPYLRDEEIELICKVIFAEIKPI